MLSNFKNYLLVQLLTFTFVVFTMVFVMNGAKEQGFFKFALVLGVLGFLINLWYFFCIMFFAHFIKKGIRNRDYTFLKKYINGFRKLKMFSTSKTHYALSPWKIQLSEKGTVLNSNKGVVITLVLCIWFLALKIFDLEL